MPLTPFETVGPTLFFTLRMTREITGAETDDSYTQKTYYLAGVSN
jgi:hypothetical protein